MGQIMLNGNAYAGGAGGACGCFVDTSNVIKANSAIIDFPYVATQDCAVYVSVSATNVGVFFSVDGKDLYSHNSSASYTYTNTIFLRRGQSLDMAQTGTLSSATYTVYGVIQGLDSTVQDRYSTEERAVGIWIDGSTIYEKTIILQSGVNLTRGSWTSVSAVTLSGNEDTFINTKALLPSHKAWMTFAGKNSGGTFQIFSETAFTIQGVIIQYTKASA